MVVLPLACILQSNRLLPTWMPWGSCFNNFASVKLHLQFNRIRMLYSSARMWFYSTEPSIISQTRLNVCYLSISFNPFSCFSFQGGPRPVPIRTDVSLYQSCRKNISGLYGIDTNHIEWCWEKDNRKVFGSVTSRGLKLDWTNVWPYQKHTRAPKS